MGGVAAFIHGAKRRMLQATEGDDQMSSCGLRACVNGNPTALSLAVYASGVGKAQDAVARVAAVRAAAGVAVKAAELSIVVEGWKHLADWVKVTDQGTKAAVDTNVRCEFHESIRTAVLRFSVCV